MPSSHCPQKSPRRADDPLPGALGSGLESCGPPGRGTAVAASTLETSSPRCQPRSLGPAAMLLQECCAFGKGPHCPGSVAWPNPRMTPQRERSGPGGGPSVPGAPAPSARLLELGSASVLGFSCCAFSSPSCAEVFHCVSSPIKPCCLNLEHFWSFVMQSLC